MHIKVWQIKVDDGAFLSMCWISFGLQGYIYKVQLGGGKGKTGLYSGCPKYERGIRYLASCLPLCLPVYHHHVKDCHNHFLITITIATFARCILVSVAWVWIVEHQTKIHTGPSGIYLHTKHVKWWRSISKIKKCCKSCKIQDVLSRMNEADDWDCKCDCGWTRAL